MSGVFHLSSFFAGTPKKKTNAFLFTNERGRPDFRLYCPRNNLRQIQRTIILPYKRQRLCLCLFGGSNLNGYPITPLTLASLFGFTSPFLLSFPSSISDLSASARSLRLGLSSLRIETKASSDSHIRDYKIFCPLRQGHVQKFASLLRSRNEVAWVE